MTSRILRQRSKRHFKRQADKALGSPAAVHRFSSARSLFLNVPDPAKLPVEISDETLQNPDGSFVFLTGYD